jgi:hypothetical protein
MGLHGLLQGWLYLYLYEFALDSFDFPLLFVIPPSLHTHLLPFPELCEDTDYALAMKSEASPLTRHK